MDASNSSPYNSIVQLFRVLFLESKNQILGLMAITCLSGIVAILNLYLSKLLIDSLVDPTKQALSIWYIVAAQLFGAALLVVLQKLQNYFQSSISQVASQQLRIHLTEHALKLDIDFFDNSSSFDKYVRAREQAGFAPIVVVTSILEIVESVVKLTGFIGIIVALEPMLLLGLSVAIVPTYIVTKRAAKQSNLLENTLVPDTRRADYYEKILTQPEFAKEVRSYGYGSKLMLSFKSLLKMATGQRLYLEQKISVGQTVAEGFTVVSHFIFVIIVIRLALLDRLSIGDVTMFIGAIMMFQSSLATVVQSFGELFASSLFMKELKKYFQLKPTVVCNGDKSGIAQKTSMSLEARSLSFTYPGTNTPILSDIEATFCTGSITAIVGTNGAGKSTLTKMLMRLYEPSSGVLLLNGKDVRELNLIEYRSLFSVVFQDYSTYYFSLKENIALGDQREIDINRIYTAIQRAGLTELLENLPNGIDSNLGRFFDSQGTELSVGQWQRVAIARAMYRDSPFLILDEPSSSLDAAAEQSIFDIYRTLASEKVCILVSHRMNTVKLADKILVLHRGRIAERGHHSQLVKGQGLYTTLYNSQAHRFRD